VFLLREVFDYGEIAGVTGKTEAACRQVFTRARHRVDEGRPRFETSRTEGAELTALFLAAAAGGGAVLTPAWVNRQPGLLARDADADPDKLRHIGPVSRTWHLRWSDLDHENGGVTPPEEAAS
jgi:hypothetical protein